MNYKLIMLPQPILVSDEEIKEGDSLYHPYQPYSFKATIANEKVWIDCKKIIAGIEGLPKLDLSAIAKQIGWVDVEKLAEEAFNKRLVETNQDVNWVGYGKGVDNVRKSVWIDIWISGFKAAQSLNEKKFTLADIQEAWDSGKHYGQKECEFYNTDSVSRAEYERCESKEQFIQELSKPKEYQVQYTQEGNTIKVTKIIN